GPTVFGPAALNVFTKRPVKTTELSCAGGCFTVFVVTERITSRQRAADKGKLDQFQLTSEPEVGIEALHCRPGGVLVPVRDYNTLTQVEWAVEHTPQTLDVIVMTVRLLRGPDGSGHELGADELFTDYEQVLDRKSTRLNSS